jgi:hypothetical protein
MVRNTNFVSKLSGYKKTGGKLEICICGRNRTLNCEVQRNVVDPSSKVVRQPDQLFGTLP